jgi:hypothetical protein
MREGERRPFAFLSAAKERENKTPPKCRIALTSHGTRAGLSRCDLSILCAWR